jgi:lipopolysaccharide biosynthesis glycosyltransferase
MLRMFIGYDPNEVVAYHVFAHSILRHCSEPVSIAPVMLSQLCADHLRPRDPLASTEFSFTRFLVPFLCDYSDWALFADCDMLARADLVGLWDLRDPNFAVQVVKHNHVPNEDTKFLGATQTRYDKKNWSSVMLFNCARCKALTPDYVETASGLDLHQFKWLASEDQIGALPRQWNHLVGYDAYDKDAAIVHYTQGGPYFNEYKDCEYSTDWWDEWHRHNYCRQRTTPAHTMEPVKWQAIP